MTCNDYFVEQFFRLCSIFPFCKNRIEDFDKGVFHSGFENYRNECCEEYMKQLISTGIKLTFAELVEKLYKK